MQPMDSQKVPQHVDIDFLIFSWTTGNRMDLSTMFSTEIGGLIFPWGWRNNNHRRKLCKSASSTTEYKWDEKHTISLPGEYGN